MNSDEKKPAEVLGDLEGIRDLLDESLLDEDNIPTLEQSIPELNEKIEITDDFKISFDADNSTETVEQQLARTHHEETSATLELIPELTEELPTVKNEVEEVPDFTFKLVETSDESVKQFSQIENITESNPHAVIQSEVEIEEDETNVDMLEQQQQEIEQIAEQELAPVSEVETVEDINTESANDVEMADLILKSAWVKVEMLLMDNLPPQLSGAFLELLNSRIEESKLQLFEELALLDKSTFNELLESVDTDHFDTDQSF